MKKIIYFSVVILLLTILNSGCYDRDIIEDKGGISLPKVNDLQATRSVTTAIVSWNIPSNIPEEFNRPLTVNIQVYKGKSRIKIIDIDNEANSYTVTGLEENESYRIIVKLRGNFKEPEFGKSNDVYSLGETVTVE